MIDVLLTIIGVLGLILAALILVSFIIAILVCQIKLFIDIRDIWKDE